MKLYAWVMSYDGSYIHDCGFISVEDNENLYDVLERETGYTTKSQYITFRTLDKCKSFAFKNFDEFYHFKG